MVICRVRSGLQNAEEPPSLQTEALFLSTSGHSACSPVGPRQQSRLVIRTDRAGAGIKARLFTRNWIAAGASFRHPVRIDRAGRPTLCTVRIARARNSNGRLTSRCSWICRLGLARDRLTILGVGFPYTRILGAGICSEQHRCRHQSYDTFHRMRPLSSSRSNCRSRAHNSCSRPRP
jgi:hypothetical protein